MRFWELVCKCAVDEGKDRPSFAEIVVTLKELEQQLKEGSCVTVGESRAKTGATPATVVEDVATPTDPATNGEDAALPFAPVMVLSPVPTEECTAAAPTAPPPPSPHDIDANPIISFTTDSADPPLSPMSAAEEGKKSDKKEEKEKEKEKEKENEKEKEKAKEKIGRAHV